MPENLEWQCGDCGHQFYRRNPRGCPKCGETVFYPVEVEAADMESGHLQTEDFDTNAAIDRLQEMKPDTPVKRTSDPKSGVELNDDIERQSDDDEKLGIVARLRSLFGLS